jgi:hypothetical protein
LADRNTVTGIFFITAGAVVAGLGYIGARNVPIAAFGFSLLVFGALILLLLPEPVPKDAYRALFEDSIRNIELILEESQLKEKAYFVPVGNEVRAVIPISKKERPIDLTQNSSGSSLVETLTKAPVRFIESFGDARALVLVPPGSKIVADSKTSNLKGIELALRRALVSFSELATSLDEAEEENGMVKIQIRNTKLNVDLPYFRECLGSPVSCIASCVVSSVKGLPVQIVEEVYDPALVRLTLRIFS